MSDDRPRPLSGQVLPAERSETHLPIERPLSGIPLLNRMRYRAVRRELEEYLSVLQTRNAVLREIGETVRISEDYNRALVRAERLDDLRRIEGLKIATELDAALENALDQHEATQINVLHRRARRADAETAAIAAEHRLDAMKNAPSTQPSASAADRLKVEMAKLRAREKALIEALLEGYGREEAAPEDIREMIANVRLATRDHIAKLIDEPGS